MKIELITNEQYNKLSGYFESNPNLVFQNNGYEYIDPNILTSSDKKAIKEIETLLKKHIEGFSKFTNFLYNKNGKKRIRLQYNYNYDNNSNTFIGVGYILLDELLNGFEN